MPIAAASAALVRHLRDRLEEAGALEGWTVEAMTLPEARTRPGHGIALVLWRVQPDEPQGTLKEIRDGLAYVLGVPWLWITIFLASFILMIASGSLPSGRTCGRSSP